jgi:hypothetical protein
MVALLPLHALQATPGTPGCAPLHAPATSVGAHVDGRVAFDIVDEGDELSVGETLVEAVTLAVDVEDGEALAVEVEDGEAPTDSEGVGEALAEGVDDASKQTPPPEKAAVWGQFWHEVHKPPKTVFLLQVLEKVHVPVEEPLTM